MARVLIVFESKYGQTEKIAKFISDRLLGQGHTVSLVNLATGESQPPSNYDGVIVGAGIYMQRYLKNMERWVQTYAQTLRQMPSALFTVCLAVMQKNAKVQADLHRISQRFSERTGWFPQKQATFAGALNYTQYGWFLKQFMSLISRSNGGAQDTSRDYEYTDWNEVIRFCDDFTRTLPAGRNLNPEIRGPL